MSSTASYTDVLKDIQDFYTENSVKAYAPSIDSYLEFKPLSVSQMKRFIELQVSASKEEANAIPSIDAAKELTDCLVENYIGKDTDELTKKLTTLDRDCIIAQLRANNNPVIEINQQNAEPYQTSIEHVLTLFKDNKLPDDCRTDEKVFKFKGTSLKIKMRLPTLELDSLVNSYFKSELQPVMKQGKKALKKNLEKILTQTLFIELSKYIEYIEISKSNKNTLITYDNEKTISNNLKVLEELPSNLIVEVNNFIRNIKNYKDSVLYYIDEDGNEKSLVVDINLFTTI